MDEPDARDAARAPAIDYVNHNLNTSRRHYPAICSTHTYEDRVATVESARRAGMSACSGVIVGMGETDDDLVDVAHALAALGPTSLPVNFLHPIDGTPLGDREPPAVGAACAHSRCSGSPIRAPRSAPRAAASAAWARRKPLALYAANSVFVQGYLTTAGQAPARRSAMVAALGFEIETADRRMDRAQQM